MGKTENNNKIKPAGSFSLKQLTEKARSESSIKTGIENPAVDMKAEDVINENEETAVSADKETKQEKKVNKHTSVDKSQFDSLSLNDWIEKAKSLKSGSNEPVKMLYINEDIVEIFSMIKKEEKVSMKDLIRAILESWIVTYRDEIKHISKKNRFL